MAYAFRRENKGTSSFTGMYQGPDGKVRSAGTLASRRAALRAAHREEQAVHEGRWRDRSLGEITFAAYVETSWLPNKHLEVTTRAAYRSNLDRHFLPVFGSRPMAREGVMDRMGHAQIQTTQKYLHMPGTGVNVTKRLVRRMRLTGRTSASQAQGGRC